jgi:hypothetical protein
MARNIDIIQKQIIDRLAIDGIVVSNNKFSRRRIWTYVVAYCIWILENIMDVFKAEIDETIFNKNPHTLKYLENLVLAFQYGYDLMPDKGYYDNTGLSNEDIAASKIIAHCSITNKGRILAIKVAKNNGSDLTPLSNTELMALLAYLKRVMDAGVFYAVINEAADSIKFSADVYYNPMLIDANGISIFDGTPVVKNTIKNYLKQLPYNGKYSLQKQVDELQKIDGVEDVKLNLITVKSAVGASYETVEVFYLPISGYLRILNEVTDLTLNFIAA